MTEKITALMLVLVMFTANDVAAQKITVWKAADLKAAMDTSNSPTVINFWATFCKPCIAELPHFQQLADAYREKGLKLMLVSLDLKDAYPKQIAKFAAARKLTAPVFFLDESNADLFVPLVDSTWSGAIPASLFINRKKDYRRFLEEELSREKLEAEIRKML
jgi:thiol-disulfide isomerase/thioredoxin